MGTQAAGLSFCGIGNQAEIVDCVFYLFIYFTFFFFLPVFLGPHWRHMEVPRPGVESKLQLPTYTTATATPDPSRICDLHHSSRQHQILLREARDRTHILMDASRVCYC